MAILDLPRTWAKKLVVAITAINDEVEVLKSEGGGGEPAAPTVHFTSPIADMADGTALVSGHAEPVLVSGTAIIRAVDPDGNAYDGSLICAEAGWYGVSAWIQMQRTKNGFWHPSVLRLSMDHDNTDNALAEHNCYMTDMLVVENDASAVAQINGQVRLEVGDHLWFYYRLDGTGDSGPVVFDAEGEGISICFWKLGELP